MMDYQHMKPSFYAEIQYFKPFFFFFIMAARSQYPGIARLVCPGLQPPMHAHAHAHTHWSLHWL